ncbi:hypothetical protein [Sphingomonas sp.]|uniref:hypothetical protein n=1 Tax=Sphingomonas sp. TaxID=28214 RepID=UPI0035C7A1A0
MPLLALGRHASKWVEEKAGAIDRQAYQLRSPIHCFGPGERRRDAGLAYARSGELARTRVLWRRAVGLSPEGASYRRDIARLLAVVEMQVAAGQGRP